MEDDYGKVTSERVQCMKFPHKTLYKMGRRFCII